MLAHEAVHTLVARQQSAAVYEDHDGQATAFGDVQIQLVFVVGVVRVFEVGDALLYGHLVVLNEKRTAVLGYIRSAGKERFFMGVRRRYEKSFKLQAARMVAEQGYSYAEAAARLEVNLWTLRDWVKKFQVSGEVLAKGAVAPVGDELKSLRDENRRLRLENDILKKATAYFARDSL